MKNFLTRYSTLAIILLPIVILILMQATQLLGIILSITYVLFGLIVTGYFIFKRHKKIYLQYKVSHYFFIRNNLFEIAIILLGLLLAALLGEYLAVLGTRQISHEMTRLLVGLVIGLLAGAVTGAIIKGISNRMVKS